MRCPKCGSLEDKVIDSRLSKDGDCIRRRRECLTCETRFTTYEQIERLELRAIKRDGRHEPFDRHKLLSSFHKACEKRPIGLDAIERCVEQIIHELEAEQRREISTRDIGLKVMEKLHGLDPVAYVRYASVYREFQEIGDFLEEIQTMERKPVKTDRQPELFNA
jgi:transcriptional repressor NrdR